jgi:hemerythrin-like domain-containing protein
MKLMDRLRDKASVTDVLPLLDQLRTLLIVHFAREQLPDGFYEALGELAESRRGELQTLIDEHATILSNLNEMLEQAKQSGAGNQSELLDRLSALLQQLDGHEQKEHQFAVDVLGERAEVG